jgi:hypothetical protein
MAKLAELSRATGAFVLGVDHFGKAQETGTRGSSAKEASADVVLAVLGDRSASGEMKNTRLVVRKNRSGSTGAEFAFTTSPVNLGVDDAKRELSSLVIQWKTTPAAAGGDGKSDPWARRAPAVKLLRKCIVNLPRENGLELASWPDGSQVLAFDREVIRKEFYATYSTDGETEKARQEAKSKAFRRALGNAQEHELIDIREIDGTTWVWLGDRAKDASPVDTSDPNADCPF